MYIYICVCVCVCLCLCVCVCVSVCVCLNKQIELRTLFLKRSNTSQQKRIKSKINKRSLLHDCLLAISFLFFIKNKIKMICVKRRRDEEGTKNNH